jgi:protein O-mannosyl-transferase
MPFKSAKRLHPQVLATMILMVGLLVTWFAYAPGTSGTPHFDDESNLGQLAAVEDSTSAFRFITSGRAGPLGRPLALASFIPEAYAWPHLLEVFLRTNILIHLLNSLLVTWFLYLLGCARKQSVSTAALTAVGAGTIWMLLPILASSSLFIVQRMTTLSAFFALMGAVGYMYARQKIDQAPKASLVGMTLALAFGVALGALAKETGVLLLLFMLTVEVTLLKPPYSLEKRTWKIWISIVLVAPFLGLLAYLTLASVYPEPVILRRQFTGLERLITQAEILWKYLYLGFLPNLPSLGPFHDDYPIQRSVLNPITLLSVCGWITVIVAAVAMRRRVPLFSFAIAWYLAGHLLESTTLGLELYFEHRNYLPLVGPVYALVAGLSSLRPAWGRIAVLCLSVYALILAGILFSVSSLWGNPMVAAEMWQIYKPNSKRANVFLAQFLEQDHDPYTARRVLETFMQSNPDSYGVRLYVLGISCWLEPDEDYEKEIETLENGLSSANFSYFVPNSFERLATLARDGRCPKIGTDQVYSLGLSILQNPRFQLPIVVHNVHVLLSRITLENGDFGGTMMHIEQALDSMFVPETLYLAVSVLNSGGRYDISVDLLRNALERESPRHPLRAAQWQREQTMIRAFLEATEALLKTDLSPPGR